jgi:hypothetical protein
MERSYTDTASNRLYHGEITDFYAAMQAMIQQYREEQRWIRTKYQRVDPEDAAKGMAEMDRYITAVQRCRDEYAEALRAMERALTTRWAAEEDEIPQILADALTSGDYSRCAM